MQIKKNNQQARITFTQAEIAANPQLAAVIKKAQSGGFNGDYAVHGPIQGDMDTYNDLGQPGVEDSYNDSNVDEQDDLLGKIKNLVHQETGKDLPAELEQAFNNFLAIGGSGQLPDQSLAHSLGRVIAKMKKNDPCWKGYEMKGKKKKNGKDVPNCVKK